MTKPSLLIDSCPIRFSVCEDRGDGKIRGRGVFARSGVRTANRRVYPESVWRKNINRLEGDIKERKCLAECDHPQDGKTKLQRVSHIITELTVEDDGTIMGELEVIEGTPNGAIIKALIDSGATIGVSSRGYGSVKMNENGDDVVQDDFVLLTFDVVADPANSTSWPTFTKDEKAEESKKQKDKEMVVEQKGTITEGKALQVKIGDEWKYVFSDTEGKKDPVTTDSKEKALQTKHGDDERLMGHFQNKFGNHEFRFEPKGKTEEIEEGVIYKPEESGPYWVVRKYKDGKVCNVQKDFYKHFGTKADALDHAEKMNKAEPSEDEEIEEAKETEPKLRDHLPYGFKSYTGVVWPDTHVDQYNRLQDRINASIKETGKASEELLNSSHKLMTMFSAPEEKKEATEEVAPEGFAKVHPGFNKEENEEVHTYALSTEADDDIRLEPFEVDGKETEYQLFYRGKPKGTYKTKELAKKAGDEYQGFDAMKGKIKQYNAEESIISNLKQDNQVLEAVARELGYSLFLERNLSGHPKLKQIIQSLGDLKLIESLDRLKELTQIHIEDANNYRKQSVIENQMNTLALQNKIDILSEELNNEKSMRTKILEEKALTEESLNTNISILQKKLNETEAHLHLEKKLHGNPNAFAIRKAFSESRVFEKGIADRLIESMDRQLDPRTLSTSPLFESVRHGLNRRKSLPQNNLVEESLKGTTFEEARQRGNQEQSPITGLNLMEFEKLSGMMG